MLQGVIDSNLPMNSFSQQGSAFLDEGTTISTHFKI